MLPIRAACFLTAWPAFSLYERHSMSGLDIEDEMIDAHPEEHVGVC